MKMKTLHDLFIHELKDLYSAEKQITKALPKMIKAANSGDLHEALQSHLAETEEQVQRLEEICSRLDVPTRGVKCPAMEGLVAEGQETLEHDMEDQVRDAAIICCAQRIEHYEMAAYGCARTFAEQLGHGDIAQTLQRTLDEEKAADERLSQIAMQHINEEAAVGGE